jgi:hypothetical protein
MTEEAREAIERIRKGDSIECSSDAYYSEIRDVLIHFALDCFDNGEMVRMRIALAEVNRLDDEHGYGVSAELPDNLT